MSFVFAKNRLLLIDHIFTILCLVLTKFDETQKCDDAYTYYYCNDKGSDYTCSPKLVTDGVLVLFISTTVTRSTCTLKVCLISVADLLAICWIS